MLLFSAAAQPGADLGYVFINDADADVHECLAFNLVYQDDGGGDGDKHVRRLAALQ